EIDRYRLVHLEDDRHVLRLQESLDRPPDSVDADLAPAINHAPIIRDGNENGILLEITGGGGLRSLDLDPGLFDKDGRDDEEDQEDEYNVDEGRNIDVVALAFGCIEE